ncbi:unnamed protein product [Cuscuta europaea]|uniref:Uncharacterized protein n=1 Tax=Cuscuta europaea TaxID=41803 RepID=A0A9P1E1C9_CUSEU|nr:unnamed protein product [Cuscuta europaea]
MDGQHIMLHATHCGQQSGITSKRFRIQVQLEDKSAKLDNTLFNHDVEKLFQYAGIHKDTEIELQELDDKLATFIFVVGVKSISKYQQPRSSTSHSIVCLTKVNLPPPPNATLPKDNDKQAENTETPETKPGHSATSSKRQLEIPNSFEEPVNSDPSIRPKRANINTPNQIPMTEESEEDVPLIKTIRGIKKKKPQVTNNARTPLMITFFNIQHM